MKVLVATSSELILAKNALPFWNWTIIFLICSLAFLYISTGSYFQWWPFRPSVRGYQAGNWSQLQKLNFSAAFFVGAVMFLVPWIVSTGFSYQVSLNRDTNQVTQDLVSFFVQKSSSRMAKLSEITSAEVRSGRGCEMLLFISSKEGELAPFGAICDQEAGYYQARDVVNNFLKTK